MKRSALAFLLALSFTGCAAINGNFVGEPTPNTQKESQTASAGFKFEPMDAMPPAPLKEDPPSLEAKEVWVPGYYEPVAGTWLWHQGEVRPQKEGYCLIPASYKQENGKVYFVPPRWRRADLVASKK